jgi:hypothetical protein
LQRAIRSRRARDAVDLHDGPEALARIEGALQQCEAILGTLYLVGRSRAAARAMLRIERFEIEPAPAGADVHVLRPDGGNDVVARCHPGVLERLVARVEHAHLGDDFDRTEPWS